ncbi:MAG TPA: class I SAM-dependent methyltransferase [Bdellovibrionota bacterium]|nr:class I SAM-dependent methyltransferase [Bdellovibrionota bacterium]
MKGVVYDLFAKPHEGPFGLIGLRKRLMSQARGKTLEVGAGTGFNFKYYSEGLEVIAVEPDESMRAEALKRARRFPWIQVTGAEAEALPYADESFDTAVATLAMCSVDDPGLAVREIHRVLRPGGRALFLDHVRGSGAVSGRVTDALTPPWRWISGGCRLNRVPGPWIESAGFKVIERETLWRGFGELWVLEK